MNGGATKTGSGGGDEHEVVITRREKVLIRGVLNVESFDDQQVVLETGMGTLTLKGEKLHIRQLDLDAGSFAVEGTVSALQYTASAGRDRDRGRGFFERLLR